MNLDTLKETIRQELPELLRLDPAFRSCILEITRGEYADRQETRDWFHETLDEMRRERERQDKKWDMWQERWDKHVEEQDNKWDLNKKEFNRVHEEIMAMTRRYDRSIGALGARWGMQSERSFRNALAGILEENFGVKVINVNEYDDEGSVSGRPEQVELDVIIINGLLLICEIKSSIDKSAMYTFERKVRFYESRHNRKANRLIVISPMIDPMAQKVAEQLNIETYSDSVEVESLD